MFLNHTIELIDMSFSEFDITRSTRKGSFLKQIDHLIDWTPVEKAIAQHYAPVSDAAGRPAYTGLLLFKYSLQCFIRSHLFSNKSLLRYAASV